VCQCAWRRTKEYLAALRAVARKANIPQRQAADDLSWSTNIIPGYQYSILEDRAGNKGWRSTYSKEVEFLQLGLKFGVGPAYVHMSANIISS
jgi:hypothetical protein